MKSDEDEADEEMKIEDASIVPRKLDQYVRVVHKNTEFFSTYDAEMLLQNLSAYANETGFEMTVQSDKYKIKLIQRGDDEN
jgi:hypothetical protein